MDSAQNPNLEILLLAVAQLESVANEMVFLGGCATGILITDAAVPTIRATKDVDAIVQVATKSDYYLLSEKLRKQGFSEDTGDDAPLCRWKTESVVLDVMPTDSKILGFGNKWYKAAMDNAESFQLSNEHTIRMVTAPYFLITKLEAFDGRGNGDYLTSHDIEDLIAVFDGRPELVSEVIHSNKALASVLAERCKALSTDSRFLEAVSGHMPTDETSQARVVIILKRINEIAEFT